MNELSYVGWELIRSRVEAEIDTVERYSSEHGRALRNFLRRIESAFEELMDVEVGAAEWETITGLERTQLARDIAKGILKDRRTTGTGAHRIRIRDIVRARGLKLPITLANALKL